MNKAPVIAVVIPCYRETAHICDVLAAIGPEVAHIYLIDDCCPEGTGDFVEANCADPRLTVIRHDCNSGVGGAVKTGYRAALADDADIIVKLDGDGQMDPAMIPELIEPIANGRADYCKGNRFYQPEGLHEMPPLRLFGNAVLSFLCKAMSGYWQIMDPTNGFTAIAGRVVARLPLESIEDRYFFETDMLFRLNTMRAVVCDIHMHAHYGDEQSDLSIPQTALSFPGKYISRFCKRIFYSYFLRDFNVGSIELLFGTLFFLFGVTFGTVSWFEASAAGEFASSGTVMLAALPLLIGMQLLLAFLQFDIGNQPHEVIRR